MVEIELLVGFDSEEASFVLLDGNVLALERLLFFGKVASYVRW